MAFTGLLHDGNISLRALEMSDLDTLYRWENDPSVWLVSGTTVPFSRELLSQYIQSADLDIFIVRQLRLIIEQDGRPAGAVDLFDFDPLNCRAGVGILIDPAYRRNGCAYTALRLMERYARTRLRLHQLYCNITSDNLPSLQLFGKAGYQVTGTKKDWIATPDGWTDEHLLQLVL